MRTVYRLGLCAGAIIFVFAVIMAYADDVTAPPAAPIEHPTQSN
jgi:hypothetical protein